MEIQKDVPVPAKKKESYYEESKPKNHKTPYPFVLMLVGESVLVTDKTEWKRISNAAYMVGAREGKKFMARRSGEGLRIWRTK